MTIEELILIQLTEDLVAEHTVIGCVMGYSEVREIEALNAMALGLVCDLIWRGLASPTRYGDHWELTKGESILHLINEWYRYDPRDLNHLDIVNLEITDLGRARATEAAYAQNWTWTGTGAVAVLPGHWSH